MFGRGRRAEEISPPGKPVQPIDTSSNDRPASKIVDLPPAKEISVKLQTEPPTSVTNKDEQGHALSPEAELPGEIPQIRAPEDDEEKAIGVSPDER